MPQVFQVSTSMHLVRLLYTGRQQPYNLRRIDSWHASELDTRQA